MESSRTERDIDPRRRWQIRHAESRRRVLHDMAAMLLPERPPRVARVAVVGSFSAGKSTMISTLLGERVAEAHVLPTSRCVTVFRYASRPSYSIKLPDGFRRVDTNWPESRGEWFDRWYSHTAIGSRLPSADSLAGAHVVVGMPHPLLALGVELVDTPGHDAISESDVGEMQRGLGQADAVLLLCQRHHVLSSADLAVIDPIAALEKPFAVVVTHLGRRGQRAELRRTLSERVEDVSLRWSRKPAVLWGPDPDGEGPEHAERLMALGDVLRTWVRDYGKQRRS